MADAVTDGDSVEVDGGEGSVDGGCGLAVVRVQRESRRWVGEGAEGSSMVGW